MQMNTISIENYFMQSNACIATLLSLCVLIIKFKTGK